LHEEASHGDLLLQEDFFISKIKSIMKASNYYVEELLKKCEDSGVIQRTTRNFSFMKILRFISLRINTISIQCIDWILLSLKNDEMLPSERAI
jgi:hypothetical protein